MLLCTQQGIKTQAELTPWVMCRFRATASADAPADYVKVEEVETPEGIPNPIVKIDNQTDRYHTVVTIQFGDRLGELLDTVGPSRNAVSPVG